MSSYAENIKAALELALYLSDLRETLTLSELYFQRKVLKALREMPLFKRKPKSVRLMELIAQPEREKLSFKAKIREALKLGGT